MRQPLVRPYRGAPVCRADSALGSARSVPRLDLDVAHAVVDNTAALICIFDAEGHFLLFNRACEELSGFRAAEVLDRGVWETLVVPEERQLARSEIPMIVASGRGAVVEGTWQDRWGGRHLICWHNTVLLDEHGVPDRMVCVGVDITDQRRAEARLRQLADTDVLTGLLNRRALTDALVQVLESADPAGAGCGIFYCELDGFKQVNDSLGHAIGDQLLVEVARRLCAGVRDGDLVARMGGDEFVVLCPGADRRTLERLAARVRAILGVPAHCGGGPDRGQHRDVPRCSGQLRRGGPGQRRPADVRRQARHPTSPPPRAVSGGTHGNRLDLVTGDLTGGGCG